MSEMSEVNRTLPSLNGVNLLSTTGETDQTTGASTPLKTSIPMQEVSAVREEPVPATAHYLPSDDRSTAAAAAAATASTAPDAGTAVTQTSQEEGPPAREGFEGPGHEADVRKLNGSGIAGVPSEERSAVDGGSSAARLDASTTASEPAQRSSHVLDAPGSSNPYNASEEKAMETARPVEASGADPEPALVTEAMPAPVSAPIDVQMQPKTHELQESNIEPVPTPASPSDATLSAPPQAAASPSAEAVSESRETVLSPVKVDGAAVGPAAVLENSPTTQNDAAPVSSIDEPATAGESKVESVAAPLVPADEDVSMQDVSSVSAPQPPSDPVAPAALNEEEGSNVVAAQGIATAPEPSLAPAPAKVEEDAAAPAAPSLPDAKTEDEASSIPPASGEDGPPSKRQRKSVSLGFNTGDAAKPTLAGPESTSMTPAQIKFCQNAVKALKSRPEAGPFLTPVDYVALNIPHYPDRIKEPMDLGTIDIRLALTAAAAKGGSKPTEKTKQANKWGLDPVKDVFASVEVFEHDVRLVFNNCVTFNGPDHILSQNAKTLEGVFEKQLKTLPPAVSPVTPAATTESESKMFETPGSQAGNSSNGARRASDVASRPKRDIHPPAPKDLPYADRPQSAPGTAKKKKFKRPLTAREEAYYEKIAKDQFKYVTKFVDDLHKPPLSKVAWVFFNKPTMDMDFAASYYSIIKQPISLKEIKERLVRGEYDDIEGPQEDLDLMLNNCFTFNPPDSDVYTMGQEVKKALQTRLAKMPQPAPLAEDDDDEEEEEDEENEAQVQMIRDQIAMLQAQLEGLTGNSKAAGAKMLASAKASLAAMPGKKGGTKKRRPSESSSSAKKASGVKKAKTPSAGTSGSGSATAAKADAQKAKAKKPSTSSSGGVKKRDDDVRDVTYEQKEELAAKITQLPDDRLDGALKIIAEDKPQSANDDEEIELDIDDLSPQTLYKLYRYVVRPKGKKQPSKVSASDGRKRGTGGVKRKNLDEGEEAARIARLQEQLQQFDNPEAAAAASDGQGGALQGAHDDLVASDSSSGEEDYESESEFE